MDNQTADMKKVDFASLYLRSEDSKPLAAQNQARFI